MTSLLILIPLSILILVGACAALFWAVERGQFEDLETPALLPVIDSDVASVESKDDTAAGSEASEKPS